MTLLIMTLLIMTVLIMTVLIMTLLIMSLSAPGSSVIVVLVPGAFQKYSTCMVWSIVIFYFRKNPPVEGEGGANYLL